MSFGTRFGAELPNRSAAFRIGAASTARTLAICLMLVVALLVDGCSLYALRKNIEEAAEEAGLEGHVRVSGAPSGPIVIVAYSKSARRVVDFFLLPRSGPFFFTLPAGTYQLAAFEDRNQDLSYQPGEEPAALVNDVVLRPGEHRTGLELTIDPTSSVRLPFEARAIASGRQGIERLPQFQIGTVVDINDPRFSEKNAKLGLWQPLRFLFDVGAGVYFLEKYDPHKIPVLFVHGAMGHPGNWKSLIRALDRSRFQPWLAYYPTAPHLDVIARGLVRTMSALEVKYRFPRLILVAHSMGGLVTRAAINYVAQNAGRRRLVKLPAFVSISSPWNGQAAAAAGTKYAPVVAPSWEDMAPGSAFLTQLPQTPLPAECEYTLLFSYHGSTMLSGQANDGTVTVASELSMPIQRQAAHVLGFNETHTSILESGDVAARLNEILMRAATQ